MNATAIERIRNWVEREWNPKYWERVERDLLDVATGKRPGNRFEREALDRICPDWNRNN